MISSTALPFNLKALQDQVAGLEGAAKTDGEAFLAALVQLQEGQALKPGALLGLLKEQGAEALPVPADLLPGLDPAVGGEAGELPDALLSGDPSAMLAMLMAGQQQSVEAKVPDALMMRGGRGMDMQMLSQLRAQQPADLGAENFGQVVNSALSAVRAETPAGTFVPETTISTPVQHPSWGQAVGERLVWAVRQDVSQARIRLDPPHLGPLEIKIDMTEDRTNVTINAHHAVTREVLEAEMPRLRAMLGDAGLAGVDVNVSQQQQEQQSAAGQSGSAGGSVAADGEGLAADEQEVPLERQGLGLVDHYA